jgi:hypothetical protein
MQTLDWCRRTWTPEEMAIRPVLNRSWDLSPSCACAGRRDPLFYSPDETHSGIIVAALGDAVWLFLLDPDGVNGLIVYISSSTTHASPACLQLFCGNSFSFWAIPFCKPLIQSIRPSPLGLLLLIRTFPSPTLVSYRPHSVFFFTNHGCLRTERHTSTREQNLC